jgi:hypothetical protein
VNARVHNERNLEAIKGSLRQFGQVEPILIRKANNEIIAGHGRMEAMVQLNWTEADVAIVDCDQETANAMAIALNRTGELAEWNYQTLGEMMKEIKAWGEIPLQDLGWADHEVEPLLKAEWAPPLLDGSTDTPDDSSSNKPATHKTVGFTKEQWEVVEAAMKKVGEGGDALSASEAITEACRRVAEGL